MTVVCMYICMKDGVLFNVPKLKGILLLCPVPNLICGTALRNTRLNHLGFMWSLRAAVCPPHCLWILCCACFYSFFFSLYCCIHNTQHVVRLSFHAGVFFFSSVFAACCQMSVYVVSVGRLRATTAIG